ncbi:hypothetical protein [Paenibacillus oleatilyticus]|uniref:hypothetical protein n=1 Tax=Paenibacillus oleatilyticus TaxID=2594886 RepID=UPI001C1F72C3|nr:hypothetical protein [Paenibacillus oleatilyticus]MBU7316409.1 hypothetical protein [Paenibacillus oleatilyticus]
MRQAWQCRLGAEAYGLWKDEKGSAHLLLFGLLGMMTAAFIWVIAFNWMMQTYGTNKTKPLLDRATHAASLDIVPEEAALGRLVWDRTKGTDDFYRYLRLNLKLDSDLTPGEGSHLREAPTVHHLEFVTSPAYPYVLQRTVTVHTGTAKQTTRSVQVTIYGPSVVAIVETNQPLLGLSSSEPAVLSSVASVRFR